MTLNLFNPDNIGTFPVTIEETTFHVKALPLGKQQEILEAITVARGFDALSDALCQMIDSIDGFEGKAVEEILKSLTDFRQFKNIIDGVVQSLGYDEALEKNFDSSLTPPSLGPTGNVERTADEDASPVLTKVEDRTS